eukprot:TRINITY_DN53881_c0_g1_i1.p1 TRINITY_DN53881_c0_g1~~TRINITY_DN53881_c0_g1_i1.p1  ORF type:complete len:217 (+),score=27.76 TRINITY_DN53881_c0_g1_i1:77-652(+)
MATGLVGGGVAAPSGSAVHGLVASGPAGSGPAVAQLEERTAQAFAAMQNEMRLFQAQSAAAFQQMYALIEPRASAPPAPAPAAAAAASPVAFPNAHPSSVVAAAIREKGIDGAFSMSSKKLDGIVKKGVRKCCVCKWRAAISASDYITCGHHLGRWQRLTDLAKNGWIDADDQADAAVGESALVALQRSLC